MAAVYVLYSPILDKFYTGSCAEVFTRIDQHLSEYFPGAFTSIAKDWVFFCIDGLSYQQARKIEAHIKRMKSRKFIENLKTYPDLQSKLITLYQ